MKTKIVQCIPALLALLAIGFSYFSQRCAATGQVCFRTILDRMIPEITYPLYFFAIYFLPIALVLAFVPREIFKSWLRLALWAIPLAVVYIWTTPVWSTSLLPFDRDDAARLAGGAFAIVSLVLIAWKWFVARRGQARGV